MKHFFFALALLSSLCMNAQAEQFVDSIILSGLPLQVMVEDATNTPIIVQQYSYVGLDRMTGDSLWSIDRKGFSGISQKLSDNHDEALDVVDVLNVPFVFINGILVDVRNGNKLISEEDEVKLFRSSHIMADDDLSLVEVSVKGGTRLYGFSITDGARRFSLDLNGKPGLSLGGNASASAGREPVMLDAETILYFDKQNLYRINIAKGNIDWMHDEKVKKTQVVNDGKHLLLLYPPGGLSLADFDKEFQLLDIANGTAMYKKPLKMDGNIRQVIPHDGGLAVIHSDGMNIYDFDGSEDGRWKKNFKENGIKSFEMEGSSMMVYFKNKRMKIDPSSGEELMKKAEKLDRPGWTGYEPKATFEFAGEEIKVWGSNSIEVNGEKMTFAQIAFDEANNRIVMAIFNETGSSFRKEVYNYSLKIYDVKTKSTATVGGYNISSGIGELEVVDGRILAYARDGMNMFHATVVDGSIEKGTIYHYNPIKRKGAKTAKTLGRLLGGDTEEEALTEFPGYVQQDSPFYRAATKPGFKAANYPKTAGSVFAILGTPNRNSSFAGLPYLFVVDKSSGEEVMRDLLFYDNSQFTLDASQNLIYVIHGKSVRWYQF